jgi:hypothetical protein
MRFSWRTDAFPLPNHSPRRKRDPTVALPTNRLLASWGQDARELQVVL